MKKQSLTTSQERKMKFAEAGILITLVLALTIFVGTRLTSPDSKDVAATENAQSSVISETAGIDDPNEIVLAREEESIGADDVEPGALPEEIVEPMETVIEEETVVEEESVPVTYASAEQTFFAGNFEEAAAMFSRYTDDHGSNAWGFYMLGLAEWKAGDPEAAEDAFLHALQLKPEHLKSRVNFARVLIQMDRNEEAQAQIEMALAVNPNSVDATRVMGRVQHNLGLLDEAVGSYRVVLAGHSDDVWALNNLGLVLIEQENFEDALAPLAKASLIRDDVACIQNNLGIALERTGHFTAAGEAFTRALAADENYLKATDSLARVENLSENIELMPVDLAALAAGFTTIPTVEGMEVATAIDTSTPEIDEPETDGSRNR